jgi:UDP-N-acetylmuramoylalanine--D-glutamate ligase
MKKVAILGFAREGRAAYEYWNRDGNQLTICDQDKDTEVPEGATAQLGRDYLHNLGKFDVIVRTSGLHPNKIQAANPEHPRIMDKVTTSVNEFMRAVPTRNIIGVTGTKGKGTTCTLILKILEAAGHRVHLGGNIGIAPLDLLKGDIRPNDWVVLELSSYQLIDIKQSPRIAVCLMVAEEHLSWHGSMDEYLTSKQELFKHQAEDNLAIYCSTSTYALGIAKASPGLLIPYMISPGAEVVDDRTIMIDGQTICDVSEIKLLGRHNWQNVCAAITTAWNITQDIAAIHRAVTGLAGLPNRLELVREVDGVHYYNDSFASAPDATVAGLEAIEGTKVLIIGGFDKGLNLNELGRGVLKHQHELRRVIIIGETRVKMERTLRAHGFRNFDTLKDVGMKEIVAHARKVARSGDKVVLSPGFASFDMFKDFEERGRQFKHFVNAL